MPALAKHLTRCMNTERDREGAAGDWLLGFVTPGQVALQTHQGVPPCDLPSHMQGLHPSGNGY